ncbi:hypothetical protein FRC10_007277 [Ceratobasidium sp. 414]|nr:hypothetical protein FRC10_007277 [Ceratobasidium sp. 414]
MPSDFFRFFSTAKRSDVSPATDNTTLLPKAVDSNATEETLENQVSHPSFKKVQQTWNYSHGKWSEAEQTQTSSVRRPSNRTRIVAYNRKNGNEGNYDHIWVEFKSPTLIELLEPEFKGVANWTKWSASLDARLIYKKRERLATCIREKFLEGLNPDEDTEAKATPVVYLEAVQQLLDYIESEYAGIPAQIDEHMRRNEGSITWDILWALCQKGKRMQAEDSVSGDPIAFEVVRWAYKPKGFSRKAFRYEKPARFKVHGRYVQWSGYQFVDVKVKYKVNRFTESTTYSTSWERQVALDTSEDVLKRVPSEQRDSRVMVDVVAYRKQYGDYHWDSHEHYVSAKGRTSSWRTTISEDDPDICLLPPGIHGWNFRTKSWGSFLIDCLSPIDFNSDAFGHLVLDENYKQLVLAFVNAYTKKDKENNTLVSDVVKGKGGGVVMLLHGGPGTGKTLTAEAVADYLQRPLYVVSCSELTLSTSQLEGQLTRVLEIAAGWNSVVLIDEADIFLQARDNNLERSGLVSIFLRVLEYHEGASRKILWAKFLNFANAITPDNRRAWEQEIEKLSSRVMNGRTIKNTVRSAQTLATEQKAPLDPSHRSEEE